MKFKSPTAVPVQVVLLSGHSTNIGPEFEEVADIFINEALARGCLPQKTVHEPSTARVKAGEGAQGQNDDPAADYRKAFISMLERKGTPEGEADFTADGTPNTNSVSKLVGFRANKEELLAVWHELVKEADGQPEAAGEGAQGEDAGGDKE